LRVKKLVKRLLTILAVALTVVVVGCTIGLILLRATPRWYQLPKLTAEQKEAAAQSATNKLALIQNEAARIRAQERSRSRSPTAESAPSAGITVSFSDHELNAFFDKWAAWNNWKSAYEKYLTDPVIVLEHGRLIMAGRVRELGTIASLHFEPQIDKDGMLRLELTRVLGGRLPLPEAVLGDYRQRFAGLMAQQMPRWRRSAAIDRHGQPNTSAVCATMGTLLLKIMEHEEADPVLFLPLIESGFVPVKLTQIQIEDHKLTFTVQPLPALEREQLLTRIKSSSGQ
jgi:uncharacterized protein YpmS